MALLVDIPHKQNQLDYKPPLVYKEYITQLLIVCKYKIKPLPNDNGFALCYAVQSKGYRLIVSMDTLHFFMAFLRLNGH